ncbi:hypothetical protein KIM67_17820 [Flagellimonas sp. 389]|nr:hypothetical protein [Flagellimonas sp. 389]MBS9464286.1 hypothetical protein [Flagellimonas sp. 389]
MWTAPKNSTPKQIQKEVGIARSFYPELDEIPIEFKFKDNIKRSVMLAQPAFSTLLKSKKNRAYKILISKKFKISGRDFKTTEVPSDVLIGWLGHELGHVMDYQNRSGWDLINFGIRYVLLKEHVKTAERAADSFAVRQGMAEYIIKTKRFILDNAEIDQAYKDRIKEYYLSPEEIMEMVKKIHHDEE